MYITHVIYFWDLGTPEEKKDKCLPATGKPHMGVSKPKRIQLKQQGSADLTSATRRTFKHVGILPFPELDFSGLIQERG